MLFDIKCAIIISLKAAERAPRNTLFERIGDHMSELTEKCTLARDAAQKLLSVSTAVKDRALDAIADALVERTDEIIAANELDLKTRRKTGSGRA